MDRLQWVTDRTGAGLSCCRLPWLEVVKCCAGALLPYWEPLYIAALRVLFVNARLCEQYPGGVYRRGVWCMAAGSVSAQRAPSWRLNGPSLRFWGRGLPDVPPDRKTQNRGVLWPCGAWCPVGLSLRGGAVLPSLPSAWGVCGVGHGVVARVAGPAWWGVT